MKKVLLALTVFALVLMPMAAMADTIEYFICDGNEDLSAFAGEIFATVKITVPDGGGPASFEINRNDNFTFGGNQAFAATFSVLGNAADVADLTTDSSIPFVYSFGTQNVSDFGNFDDIIEQQSFNDPATSLTFTVNRFFANAGSVLVENADGYLIAMHIQLPDGVSTGFAGNCDRVPPQAPIPGSLLLLGTGVLGLIGLRRKF